MIETIRERALNRLVSNFASIQAGQPSSDPYQSVYDYVRRNPLDEDSYKKRLTLGVHDVSAKRQQGFQWTMYHLRVVLEFRCLLQTGEVASTVGNDIIGEITRKIWEDKQLGGLAIDVIDESDELYIDDFDRRQLSGAVFLEIQLRTLPHDPRVQI